MSRKPQIDWDAMEPDWRAGLKSVLQLSEEYGVSRAAIIKHWKKEGVDRDLEAKIRAKAAALVTQSIVTPEVTESRRVTEKLTIEANACAVADTILNQRADVRRARSIVSKLFSEVEAECDEKEAFAQIGEILAAPDENGRDRLNDLYRAAISLPERVKSTKALSDALKVLVELERKVMRIDDQPPEDTPPPSSQPASGAVTLEAVTALMDKITEARGKS